MTNNRLGDVNLDMRIILILILKKYVLKILTRLKYE